MKELNVKVGDKLLYSYGYSYNITERIVEVTKVTPTGRIRVTTSDSQYDKYGHEIGNHNILNCKSKLSILTEEDIERITQNNAIAKAFSYSRLSLCSLLTIFKAFAIALFCVILSISSSVRIDNFDLQFNIL